MRTFSIFILFSVAFFSSCKKDIGYTCKCDFPFQTGNNNTTFLAVHGDSYWHNDDCWSYLGPTKTRLDRPPSNPGSNPIEWRKCRELHKDCNSISATTSTWTPGIYYKGDKVKLNNKIYIAFIQGNPMPESPVDDIWAKLCE